MQRRADDGLVLDGIEGACGVDKAAARLEILQTSEEDAQLKAVHHEYGVRPKARPASLSAPMQAEGVERRPFLPDLDVFAQCPITGARDVGEDAIVLQHPRGIPLAGSYPDIGQVGGV